MKRDAVNKVAADFAGKRFVDKEAVLYAIANNRNGTIPNISSLRDSINNQEYKKAAKEPLSRLKARALMANLKES